MRISKLLFALWLVALPAVLVAQDRVTVTSKQFGDKWPLTVPSVTLRCIGRAGTGSVVIDVPSKGTFALNGTARMQMKKDRSLRWKEVGEIQRPDPTFPKDLKVSVAPLIERGLTLCRR
jgi:hypothetical protein